MGLISSDPGSILIGGIAHLVGVGEVKRRDEVNYIVFYQEVAALTWCGVSTADGRFPRADDLLTQPLNICPDCRAMAMVTT